MVTVVELRPNRSLLDHEFEGYKLNLQALPHYCHDLIEPVDKVYPDEVQYSFVHANLFALHNHLILDHWDYSFSYYYIDSKQQVRHVLFENTTHTFENVVCYDVPAHVERKSGHFNLCLSFPSHNLAVISDGTGYLHIVETGNRNRPMNRNQTWQTLYSNLALGKGKYFVIVDSRIQEKDNTEFLHCLIQSVEQSDSSFYSLLTWIIFKSDGQTWEQESIKQLKGKGLIHYASIESSCTGLYIASDNIFEFIIDTENEIIQPQKEFKKIIYTWLQTTDDVTITLQLEPKYDKSLFFVLVTPLAVKISYAGKVFIDGKLSHKVDSELTTWNIQENGQVDILLTKSESSLWKELLEGGDPNGEQMMDASLVDEVHKQLVHLCSETEVTANQPAPALSMQELEECDVASEEDTVLVRLDVIKHQVTHKVSLSVHQYLFSIKLENQEVPAVVLRHDVDACIWQPYAQLINSETWPLKHQGTLTAFGYVQSSKQNRKFLSCSPNFSYSVVCESARHIFIYQNENSSHSQLRKRTGGAMKNVKVGQQYVINIDKYGEVLGINATNEYLFILTEKSLIVTQIC